MGSSKKCDLHNFLTILNKIYLGMLVIDLDDIKSANMLIISGWKYINHCSSQCIDLDFAR